MDTLGGSANGYTTLIEQCVEYGHAWNHCPTTSEKIDTSPDDYDYIKEMLELAGLRVDITVAADPKLVSGQNSLLRIGVDAKHTKCRQSALAVRISPNICIVSNAPFPGGIFPEKGIPL